MGNPLRLLIESFGPLRSELAAKEPEGSAHAPKGNPHLMNAFRVAAVLGGGLIRKQMTLASREDRGDPVIERGMGRQRGRRRGRHRICN